MSVIAIAKTICDIRRNIEAASDACLQANCARAFDLLEDALNQLNALASLMSPKE